MIVLKYWNLSIRENLKKQKEYLEYLGYLERNGKFGSWKYSHQSKTTGRDIKKPIEI